MRRLLPLLLLLGLARVSPVVASDVCSVPLLDDRCEAWSALYDNPGGYGAGGKDITFDVAAGGGRVVVTGRSEDDGTGGYDAYTVAYAAGSGNLLWAHRFDSGGPDSGNALTLSPDASRVYVTGYRGGGQLLLLAYDAATGELLWDRSYASAAHASTVGIDVEATDGRVYAAAIGINSTDDRDVVTVAFDAAGALAWATRHDRQGARDEPIGLEVAPDGTRVFVAASSRPCCGSTGDYLALAYDAGLETEDGELPPSAGALLWDSVYDGPAGGRDLAQDATIRPDGSLLYVTGSSIRVPGSLGTIQDDSWLTAAFDTGDGRIRWAARLDGEHPGAEGAAGVAVTPDGRRVFVTGDINGSSQFDDDVGAAAYDAGTGEELWTTRYAVPGLIYEQGAAVATNGPRVFIHGFSGDGVYKGEFVTVALEASSGAQAWSARFNTADVDRPFTREITTDGEGVYATGYLRHTVVGLSCSNCNEYDYATLAYDA